MTVPLKMNGNAFMIKTGLEIYSNSTNELMMIYKLTMNVLYAYTSFISLSRDLINCIHKVQG